VEEMMGFRLNGSLASIRLSDHQEFRERRAGGNEEQESIITSDSDSEREQ
jgi:hypothetical protein